VFLSGYHKTDAYLVTHAYLEEKLGPLADFCEIRGQLIVLAPIFGAEITETTGECISFGVTEGTAIMEEEAQIGLPLCSESERTQMLASP
jgi:hypothetical protein